MDQKVGTLLSGINSPNDLKKLQEEELVELCHELREFIIEAVSHNPGHFGASLGVVELTVALHYAFNTPDDRIVWDVGHQAYAHKILTGRRDMFYTNRTYQGISGFPKMSESEYDSFGTGHSSTSISAALGMAVGSKVLGEKRRHHIAVIGDGSMTAGMAFEGLNHAGAANADLLVILNDNGIAIDKNVGALKDYLTDITTSKTYNRFKNEVWNALGSFSKYGPDARSIVQKLENAFKAALLKQSNLFESLNFRYFGPVDGHDVVHLTKVLKDMQSLPGPKLLHCVTVKGKGFSYAEKEQTKFHAPGYFNKETGEIKIAPCEKTQPPKYQVVFGQTILELAKQNDKVVGVTPAMPSGCSLNIMMAKMPDRAFDVGIAEQHAVTFSAGMAAMGLIPFCNIYSSFMQRAYDQVLHDVALQNLHVIFCLDRGGLVGEDGPTHHGAYDLAYMRSIPNMIVSAPMNEIELRNLMYTAQLKNHGPFSIRYPRGNGVLQDWKVPFEEVSIGKGRRLREGKDIAVITIGHVGNVVAEVCKDLDGQRQMSIGHYDLRFLKPIDEDLLHEAFRTYSKIITVEDGCLPGGMGSAVLEFMSDHGYQAKVKRLGIPDSFITHGTLQQLHAECGFDYKSVYQAIIEILE